MKLQKLATLILSLAAACAANAQKVTVNANVPFDFVVNGKTLPAGNYVVIQTPPSHALFVREVSGKTTSAVMASDVNSASLTAPSRLVFRRYGKQYFLSQVWITGEYHDTFAPTRTERRIEAKGGDPGETILVALR